MRAASVHPDGAFTSKDTASEGIKQTNSELGKLRGEIENLEKEEGNGENDEGRKELEKKKKEEDKLCRLWWLQIGNVVEIKCEAESKTLEMLLFNFVGTEKVDSSNCGIFNLADGAARLGPNNVNVL
ncbi:hypothetical protein M422DRAFT_268654 [Sphaerobolus stellatus SS14]|uniref:Uncharacterized protein n=1 Tax=Sphaerobolus stellatus (strain SS14) TaxID=990650 RepID=A0A0C9UXN7_SPHS4|nr:hypothetical protein M422DRAFT_268654 [Sphaerobolus stellatus SS14]